MLGFTIPLKSRAATSDWLLLGRLLERTLRSACAQVHGAFHVVVVGHEIPELNFRHPQIEFVQVDGDPPGADPLARRRDKSRKLALGLARIRAAGASHVMALDADDLVSHRLADQVARRPDAHGWYFSTGYVHHEAEPWIHLQRFRFHKWCGSSNIVKVKNVETGLREGNVWRWDHRRVAAEHKRTGRPLQPLPFPGAVYNVSHGENFHDYRRAFWPGNPLQRAAFRVLFHRAATQRVREEFGIYPVRPTYPKSGFPSPA